MHTSTTTSFIHLPKSSHTLSICRFHAVRPRHSYSNLPKWNKSRSAISNSSQTTYVRRVTKVIIKFHFYISFVCLEHQGAKIDFFLLAIHTIYTSLEWLVNHIYKRVCSLHVIYCCLKRASYVHSCAKIFDLLLVVCDED
jgi:hypothetical protein